MLNGAPDKGQRLKVISRSLVHQASHHSKNPIVPVMIYYIIINYDFPTTHEKFQHVITLISFPEKILNLTSVHWFPNPHFQQALFSRKPEVQQLLKQ